VLSSVFPHLKELLEQVTGLGLLQFESFKSWSYSKTEGFIFKHA
jgi:hypothetical protein